MNPTRLAIIYSAASIFIGPLVFILGYNFTRGGGDYCDLSYRLPDDSFDPIRVTEFRNAQLFQVTGAGIMLLLGLLIITYSIASSRKKSSKLNIWAVLGVNFMMFGYILVILFSGKSGQIC